MNDNLEQELKALINGGFEIQRQGYGDIIIAFLSLRIALKSYFSTYKPFRFHLWELNENRIVPDVVANPEEFRKELLHSSHNNGYYELYAEVITHFHHFIELTLKDILRKVNPLFPCKISNPIYAQIKNGNQVPIPSPLPQTIEFSETLSRTLELIEIGMLDPNPFQFIKQNQILLEKLNFLRNRLTHRGTFVLSYPVLDNLMGKYLLPFVIQLASIPNYQSVSRYWSCQPLTVQIDPLDSIIQEFKKNKYDIGKIAFLKELGRAAYESPITRRGIRIDRGEERQAETVARSELDNGEIVYIKVCPVCGVKSLLVFEETDHENPGEENPEIIWLKTYMVQCPCCSFQITNELKNPSEYDLPIEDYWKTEKLYPITE